MEGVPPATAIRYSSFFPLVIAADFGGNYSQEA
jgi:hypothetical protein